MYIEESLKVRMYYNFSIRNCIKKSKNQETTFKGDSVKLIQMFKGCGYSPDNLILEDTNSRLESVGLALALDCCAILNVSFSFVSVSFLNYERRLIPVTSQDYRK